MDRPGKLQQAAALVVSLAMAWAMLPEHQQRLLAMRAVHALRGLTARWARAEGHAGMGNELAGQPEAAERQYGAAYHLSRARDAFGRVLEGMRP